MALLQTGDRDRTETAITGQLVPCPECQSPTGVPLPRDCSVVDDAAESDGSSPTRCPDCETGFHVHYALETAE